MGIASYFVLFRTLFFSYTKTDPFCRSSKKNYFTFNKNLFYQIYIFFSLVITVVSE